MIDRGLEKGRVGAGLGLVEGHQLVAALQFTLHTPHSANVSLQAPREAPLHREAPPVARGGRPGRRQLGLARGAEGQPSRLTLP